jgi:hypothetical protein
MLSPINKFGGRCEEKSFQAIGINCRYDIILEKGRGE